MEHSVSMSRTRTEMINNPLGEEMPAQCQMFIMIQGDEWSIVYQRQEPSKPSEHLNLGVC